MKKQECMILGFGPVRLGPGETKRIEQVPQVPFKIEYLRVTKRSARKFLIVDIKVGKNSQLVSVTPLPAIAFVGGERGLPISVSAAEVGQTLTLVVQNRSENFEEFSAVAYGTADLSL